MKTKSKVKVKSKRDETVIEGQWRATARSSNAQNAVRRSESARLLCKPKGKRRLAACSRWKFRFRQAARTPLPLCGTHENERKTKMKLKIDWKTLGRMIWDAVKPDVDASVVPK